MKKLVYIILTAVILITCYTSSNKVVASPQESTYVSVLVGYKRNIDPELRKIDGIIKEKYENIKAVKVTIPVSELNTLKENKDVTYIEEDTIVNKLSQTVDWGISKIEAPLTWSNGYTGKGVKIAIIDSGISTHDDLDISGGISFVKGEPSYEEGSLHGTHVAGIIGAKNNDIGVVGVAPDSEIYAIKSLDSRGNGYISDVIEGIDWAVNNQMDIINLSLGTNVDSQALREAVDIAYENGILLVAGAGNDASTNSKIDTVDYPAKYDSVIAVGATTESDEKLPLSSTGESVEVSAPGYNILSTNNNNGYVAMEGTSMAAPFVAGFLALLIEQYPQYSNTEIRDLLATKVVDLGKKGKDPLFGYGLINTSVVDSAKKDKNRKKY